MEDKTFGIILMIIVVVVCLLIAIVVNMREMNEANLLLFLVPVLALGLGLALVFGEPAEAVKQPTPIKAENSFIEKIDVTSLKDDNELKFEVMQMVEGFMVNYYIIDTDGDLVLIEEPSEIDKAVSKTGKNYITVSKENNEIKTKLYIKD